MPRLAHAGNDDAPAASQAEFTGLGKARADARREVKDSACFNIQHPPRGGARIVGAGGVVHRLWLPLFIKDLHPLNRTA
jgi:hypothetical protein